MAFTTPPPSPQPLDVGQTANLNTAYALLAEIVAALGPTLDEALPEGQSLADAVLSPEAISGKSVQWVQHDADADFDRPDTTAPVFWVGTVQPNNMVPGDTWFAVLP